MTISIRHVQKVLLGVFLLSLYSAPSFGQADAGGPTLGEWSNDTGQQVTDWLSADGSRQLTQGDEAAVRISSLLARSQAAGATQRGQIRLPDLTTYPVSLAQQPTGGQKRPSWIARHPILFGTAVGFGTGFLVGYLPGDDAVFDDFVASFNGLVIGGIGAGVGASIGAIVGNGR